MAEDNHLLGKFELSGFPPLPAGRAKMDLTFEIDVNGILHVKAVDAMSGKSEGITITNDKGRLTEAQIEQMLKDAERFADQDQKKKEQVDASLAFQQYLDSMRRSVEGDS